MKFKLEFDIAPFTQKINSGDELFFAGSCFSENIAGLFQKYKFPVVSNPHGILYNPHSIAVSLLDCMENKSYSENDLFFANETWNSFQHHSRFSDPDKIKALKEINAHISQAHTQIKTCKHLFITFGSSFIYKELENGKLVGNCHRIPQKQFEKLLLQKEEIIEQYQDLIKKIITVNPNTNIIFTVSPVRYIRDGVTENNLSKAILLQSIHELVASHSNCTYFPAYEIMNDELRDYRFFEEDLVHPNAMAIDYVWERLSNVCFAEETKNLIAELDLIIKASAHRPFNESSEAHKKFKEAHIKKCTDLKKKFPELDLSKEEKHFI